MIKFIFSVLAVCFFSYTSFANEESVLSLFDDEPQIKNKSQSQEDKQEEKDSFFSFMNFKMPENMSFSKNDKEKNTTMEDVIKLADRGDLQAQLMLGYSYLYGEKGLKIDYTKAFEYYGKAALQNDPVGLNNLGSLYYGGVGVARSSEKAAVLFRKAAKLGNPDASINIGFMHASGNGEKKDIELALQYFESALSADSPAAKFMVGYAYYKGIHRVRDYTRAGKLLKEAADAGFDEAQTIVANMYINGLGFPQSYSSGVTYLQKAVMQGNTNAMMTLADILVEGKKYAKDIYYAHVLYNLSSVRGVPNAAQKRDAVETIMKIDEVLVAQERAGRYKEDVSQATEYIHKTYGRNIASYFD